MAKLTFTISRKGRIRLFAVLAVLLWLAMVLLGAIRVWDFTRRQEASHYFGEYLLYAGLVLSSYFYFRNSVVRAPSVNFISLLWKALATGTGTVFLSLLIRAFYGIFRGFTVAENLLLANFFYLCNLGLATLFMVSTFVIFRRLVLYQKSKRLVSQWMAFEGLLAFTLAYTLIDPTLDNMTGLVLLGLLFAFSAVLAFNLKWVAYLNVRQKWTSIVLLILLLPVPAYFFWSLLNFNASFEFLAITATQHLTFIIGSAFLMLYSFFALLVVLFNLPTSSVFEQKLEEVVSFQRLSQAIQKGHNQDEMYEILLDSSMSTVFADAGWVRISNGQPNHRFLLARGVEETKLDRLRSQLKSDDRVQALRASVLDEDLNTKRLALAVNIEGYRSLLWVPLEVQGEVIGQLVLLKQVTDGFSREMEDIVKTFVSQAAISIENLWLLSEAIENERYQEELKIAKMVQDSLLPEKLDVGPEARIKAFSHAADEVGGDYYDSLKLAPGQYALIMSDVSGKGTSAAFNMSQMKGVFHSLVQTSCDSLDFATKANKALSNCLERSSFITALYMTVNAAKQEFTMVRAGHCPPLLVHARTGQGEYLQAKGLGLGMVRSDKYPNYLEQKSCTYEPGDLLVLFTDGIIEAKNELTEEFGYARLQQIIEEHRSDELEVIEQAVIKAVTDFSEGGQVDDDYSLMLVRFLSTTNKNHQTT